MDLTEYRNSLLEQKRIGDLLAHLNHKGSTVLDIGARDGYLSIALAETFPSVTALDLVAPDLKHPQIACVQGDITHLDFPDNSFDAILCAEVLEHLPSQSLLKACAELVRVSRKYVLIGVPYRQDIRVGRSVCVQCGTKNPPWGHINQFDESRLKALFDSMRIEKITYIGTSNEITNVLSTWLMDLAGNPYGTYQQEEGCIHCGSKLRAPGSRNFLQKVCSKTAHMLTTTQRRFSSPHPNWIHVLFVKNG